MIKRTLQNKIREAVLNFPVVGILGSRQVGKTTLAKLIQDELGNSTYIDLELPSDYNKLENAEFYLQSESNKTIIIDEIQRRPELFPLLRALVDKDRKAGRFIILGSSSPELIRNSSESLAGRISYFELSPFLYDEVKNYNSSWKLNWNRGGYPNSYLAANDDLSYNWRLEFIRTFLERDIPNLHLRIPAVQLRRFWIMIAHSHGSLWNASKIAASLGVSAPTAKSYLDILEDTFIIRQLHPFFNNIKKRLVKTPKYYLRDSGLLHTLLNIKTLEDLLNNPVAGHSWEGYVVEQLINSLPKNFNFYYYRTTSGAEIDLVVTEAEKPLFCCEIKFSLNPTLGKSFWNAYEDLKCPAYIIYPGEDEYALREQIKVLPITKLSSLGI